MNGMGYENETVITKDERSLKLFSLNVNGLEDIKVDTIAWYIVRGDYDIVFQLDTQLLLKNNEWMVKLLTERLGQLTNERWIISYNKAGPEGAKYQQRTGGQIALVRGWLTTNLKNVRKDKSGLGFLIGLELVVQNQPLLVINGYWPSRPQSPNDQGLNNKMQQWMRESVIHGTPVGYIKQLIAEWSICHAIKHDGVHTVILTGDMNSTRTKQEHGGCLEPYGQWAEEVQLFDVIGEHAEANKVDVRTFSKHGFPVSAIFHILINK